MIFKSHTIVDVFIVENNISIILYGMSHEIKHTANKVACGVAEWRRDILPLRALSKPSAAPNEIPSYFFKRAL